MRQVGGDDVPLIAAALAYRFFLALFPFCIFVAALATMVAGAARIENPTNLMLGTLEDLPVGVIDLLRRELAAVLDAPQPALLSFGIVAALLAATAGTNAAIKAMNRAYDIAESRPFWKRSLIAAGLTVLAGAALVAVFVLVVVGGYASQHLAALLGVGDAWHVAVTLLRWPLAVLLLLLTIGALYRILPNVSTPWRAVAPGTVLFTIGWLGATWLFSYFVARFGTYSATYGALSGAVALLVWFYLTGFLLLAGAELNAILAERDDPEGLGAQRRARARERQRAHGGSEHAFRGDREVGVG